MRGIVYGVGVGPGDPELMTLKAVRIIREGDVIAFPGQVSQESVAYKTAAAAVPEIARKELLPINMPMVKDRELMKKAHEEGAKLIESYLDQGKNVVYPVLGDVTIYSSFNYLQHILEADGYRVCLISGVPSFCAAAASLNISLAEWDEPLHIIPAVHRTEELSAGDGNYVLMKSGSHMKEIKDLLEKTGMQVRAVENCGMETEKLYMSQDEIPDNAGYFSLLIAKQNMSYKFYGWETADVKAVSNKYPGINTPRDLYDALSKVWCEYTCAPRLRSGWSTENKTLGQCSITAFLVQDIFGGKVYGIPREGGSYHCYNVVGDCVFDLTSEQFQGEKLDYTDNPEQFREVHFAKEEKKLRYEYLCKELGKLCFKIRSNE